MAWITGGREVRQLNRWLDGKPEPARHWVSQPITLESLAAALGGRQVVDLPQHRGAGPCGCSVTANASAGAWSWTIMAIIEMQGLWGSPTTPPYLASAWGPKEGPRGRLIGKRNPVG